MHKKNVVVIGGGLGGLSAAITLAADNHAVTVIEKNTHLGGKVNTLNKNGFTFDLGPSTLTMPHMITPLFTMHGKSMEDYITLKAIHPHCRNVFEGGPILDMHETPEKTVKQNSALDEKDFEELKQYYTYAKTKAHFTNKVMFDHQSERTRDIFKHYNPFTVISHSDAFSTMDEGVRKHISNPQLVDILNNFIKYEGSSPSLAPAVMNALPYFQWHYDLWYAKGGMSALPRALETLAREVGVHFMLGSEVKGITKSPGGINGLILDDDSTIGVDVVVANMEPIPFYESISKEAESLIQPYRDQYPPSLSGIALHLGLDKQYDILKHQTVFHAQDAKKHYDALFEASTLSDDPTLYVSAPMKSDPQRGPQAGEIISILAHLPPLHNKHKNAKKDYTAYRDVIIDKLERMGLKDLRNHIVSETLWTPHTFKDTYFSHRGALYGSLLHKDKNKGFKIPKQSKFYNNLFFTGSATNPGSAIPLVILSGRQVAKQIKTGIR